MASSSKFFPANLPILDGKNLDQWCIKMNVIFGFQVEGLVSTGIQPLVANANEAQQAAFKELKKRDCK
jgi:hypothetical protein